MRISAGTPAVAGLQSANNDPEKYADPRRLDITRDGQRHLALCHGLHNRMGAALARLTPADPAARA